MSSPTWESDCGTVKLWLGDCLEVMKSWPPGAVDAVVTDPPYGIGFNRYSLHDDNEAEYESSMQQFVPECERISNGLRFVWQAMLRASDWHKWFPAGFRIFASAKNFVQFRPTSIQYSWDPVIFWGEGNTKPVAGVRDFHVANTARWIAEKSNKHPCPRPIDVVEEIVGFCGDSIADPFMGSGTTGVAAVRLGRQFWGVEIDPEYFEIAKQRIQDELNRFPLFDKPPHIQQERLFV